MSIENLVALFAVIVVFLALLAIRFHVGLSLMAAGMVGVIMLRSTDAAVSTVASQPYSASADYSLTIIPLFIVMGVFAVHGRLAAAGFDAASRLLRRLPGGTALASLAGSGMFAAVTGSGVATVATMARVSTDAIVKAGHGIKLAAAWSAPAAPSGCSSRRRSSSSSTEWSPRRASASSSWPGSVRAC